MPTNKNILYDLCDMVGFSLERGFVVDILKAATSKMNCGRCMGARIKNICTRHYTGCNERPTWLFINNTGCPLIGRPVLNKDS